MFTEIASITIDPARAAEFEAAVAQAVPLFRAAQGCHGMSLERVVEVPGEYRLRVIWSTIEDHMVTFREAPAFAQWRALAGPFFTQPPTLVHVETAVRGF